MGNECELCELKTRLHVYDETDRWIIIDCMACLLPMAVWWGSPLHTMDISDKDAQDMEKALRSVGEAKLGKGIYIDKIQNQILFPFPPLMFIQSNRQQKAKSIPINTPII